MQEKINQIMAEFCLPVEIAPITLKGTNLMTTRWEVLAKAIPNSNLAQTLPSIIVIVLRQAELLTQSKQVTW